MSVLSHPFRPVVVALALTAAVAAGAGGCAKNPTVATLPAPSPSASPSPSPSPSPNASPTITPLVFVSLAYASAAPTTDPVYGQVDGYARISAQPVGSATPGPSQVVSVPAGQPIQFYNFDAVAHTASLLGPASGNNWPSTFTNVNGASAASPNGTPITSPQFSTGALAGRPAAADPSASRVYNTGSPGMYYFGDYFFYIPPRAGQPSMRTVFIVI